MHIYTCMNTHTHAHTHTHAAHVYTRMSLYQGLEERMKQVQLELEALQAQCLHMHAAATAELLPPKRETSSTTLGASGGRGRDPGVAAKMRERKWRESQLSCARRQLEKVVMGLSLRVCFFCVPMRLCLCV